MLIDNLVTVRVKDGLFRTMDDNKADATLAEVHRFERYRFRHPDSQLVWTGYAHPVSYNLGAAVLASESTLREQLDAAFAPVPGWRVQSYRQGQRDDLFRAEAN